MTDSIEKIVQEAECVAAADEYFKARTWLMDTNDNRRIFEAGFDRAYALLSKLRAPVADERAALSDEAYAALQYVEGSLAAIANRQVVVGDVIERVDTIAAAAKRAKAALSRLQNVAHHFDAALASAPVAGEAESQRATLMQAIGEAAAKAGIIKQDWHSLSGPECLMLLDDMARAAAPQASEAVRDAAFEAVRKQLCKLPRYSFLIGPYGGVKRFADRSGNWIEFDAAHALFDPVSVDAALSAQPGAQKACNCATCRPHSVEMRMILCETCGDKRCPHAADHRNECVGTSAQNKEPKDA